MSNELIRVVKRPQTAKNILSKSIHNTTIFEKTTYGYFETGERKGQINKVVIRERIFEVFKGVFYNYQLPLRENQTVERFTY